MRGARTTPGPIANPYAPGAGQRPPELAGRDEQLEGLRVALARVEGSRPERSVVLTGLRGVGKTVLLNAMRSAAVRAGWETGKSEARPDVWLRRPLASAVHQAVRELGLADDARDHALGVVRSFARKDPRRHLPEPRAARCQRVARPAESGHASDAAIGTALISVHILVVTPRAPRPGEAEWT